MLTQKLRELGIQHYLLRAAPDGEGDWYLQGDFKKVQSLRMEYKDSFTPEFVARITARIQNRRLPLLVDIGGKPCGDQFNILRACSHSLVLYRTLDQLHEWRTKLSELDLLPIAEMNSVLGAQEHIEATYPVLQGRLCGLDRQQQSAGVAFGALLERVAGICTYNYATLEQIHLKDAPLTVLNEHTLATEIGVQFDGERPIWKPSDLSSAVKLLPEGQPSAIYGRGPVWLVAALAARISSGKSAMFDALYGWQEVPRIVVGENANVKVQVQQYPQQNTQWLTIDLNGRFLKHEAEISILLPEESTHGVVLSGKLPRWLFAALARKLAATRDWIGIHDPRRGNTAIVVYSKIKSPTLGETITFHAQ